MRNIGYICSSLSGKYVYAEFFKTITHSVDQTAVLPGKYIL